MWYNCVSTSERLVKMVRFRTEFNRVRTIVFCTNCHDEINIGDTVVRTQIFIDGEFEKQTQHPQCFLDYAEDRLDASHDKKAARPAPRRVGRPPLNADDGQRAARNALTQRLQNIQKNLMLAYMTDRVRRVQHYWGSLITELAEISDEAVGPAYRFTFRNDFKDAIRFKDPELYDQIFEELQLVASMGKGIDTSSPVWLARFLSDRIDLTQTDADDDGNSIQLDELDDGPKD